MLSFKYIIIPILASVLSQSVKVLIEFIKTKKISFIRFINGMGGMPSTHSALVSSLSAIIYIDYGMSAIFSVTLIFSLVIIYDSMGIRYESSKHAEILNDIIDGNLNEKIGHKPLEVFVGTLIGVFVAVMFSLIKK